MNGPRARTRVRERIDAGEPAVVVAGHTVSADTADFLGRFGFDGYWLEGEHGATTWDRIADISRACELWGMTAMMRIRSPRPVARRAGADARCRRHRHPPGADGRGGRRASSAPAGSPQPAAVACRWDGARTATPTSSPREASSAPCSSCNSRTPSRSTTSTRSSPWTASTSSSSPPTISPSRWAIRASRVTPTCRRAIADGLGRVAAAGRAAGTLCPPNRIEHFVELGAGFLYASFDAWIADGAGRYLSALDAVARRSALQ